MDFLTAVVGLVLGASMQSPSLPVYVPENLDTPAQSACSPVELPGGGYAVICKGEEPTDACALTTSLLTEKARIDKNAAALLGATCLNLPRTYSRDVIARYYPNLEYCGMDTSRVLNEDTPRIVAESGLLRESYTRLSIRQLSDPSQQDRRLTCNVIWLKDAPQ